MTTPQEATEQQAASLKSSAMATGFQYLVFVNNADEPIAGFVWLEMAEEWGEQHYPGVYEIRTVTP